MKTYGSVYAPWTRDIAKPVSGTVLVSVDGTLQSAGMDYTLDETTGLVTFAAPPAAGLAVTAGYEFDVPVRLDTDLLEINLTAWGAGDIPSIPIVETRL